MYLSINVLLFSTLLTSSFLHSKDVKIRRRRFARVLSLLEEWVGGNEEDYAAPEPHVKNLRTAQGSPYERADNFQYLGRPKGFLAQFLHWDENYEAMGPTLTRMVGLAKDLLEHTDVIQSIVSQELGAKRKTYDRENSEVQGDL